MMAILKRITLSLLLIVISADLYAQTVVTLTPSNNDGPLPTPFPIEDDEPIKKDSPKPGNRKPGQRVAAFIDWDSSQLILSTSENILLFEAWDDDSCLITSSTPSQFIDFLLQSNIGQLTIVIYTPEHDYIGIYQD